MSLGRLLWNLFVVLGAPELTTDDFHVYNIMSLVSFPLGRPLKLLLLISPYQRFFNKIATGGVLLMCSALVALLWANLAPGNYHHFWHTDLTFSLGSLSITKSVQHWIDEALMTLFFFTVGLEIKREILIGELAQLRRAVLPVAAAVGGMIFPALIYLYFNSGSEAAAGWGIPMATDIAFALAVLSFVDKRIPFGIKIFLSALAIVDDLGAVLVIALFYTKTIYWQYLLVSLGLLVALGIINFLKINKTLPYALLGFGVWFSILGSGIHATVAGVLVAFFIPAIARHNTDNFI